MVFGFIFYFALLYNISKLVVRCCFLLYGNILQGGHNSVTFWQNDQP